MTEVNIYCVRLRIQFPSLSFPSDDEYECRLKKPQTLCAFLVSHATLVATHVRRPRTTSVPHFSSPISIPHSVNRSTGCWLWPLRVKLVIKHTLLYKLRIGTDVGHNRAEIPLRWGRRLRCLLLFICRIQAALLTFFSCFEPVVVAATSAVEKLFTRHCPCVVIEPCE